MRQFSASAALTQKHRLIKKGVNIMGKRRTEIVPGDVMSQVIGRSDGFLKSEEKFFAFLTI
ncbi:hypothetical protein EMIT0P176_40232 [Pseudomonas sp. IT-P176]